MSRLPSVLNAKFLISGGLHREELRVQKHTRFIRFSSVLPNPKFARKVQLAVANFAFSTLESILVFHAELEIARPADFVAMFEDLGVPPARSKLHARTLRRRS